MNNFDDIVKDDRFIATWTEFRNFLTEVVNVYKSQIKNLEIEIDQKNDQINVLINQLASSKKFYNQELAKINAGYQAMQRKMDFTEKLIDEL